MNFQRAKIIACRPCKDYKIWIRFDDGLTGEVDVSSLVGKGVFAVWNSIEFFNTVHIDKQTDTVAWGEDLDLDPYVLRDQILAQKKAS